MEEEGIAQRVERLTHRLQAVRASETRRLQEVSEMLAAVQSRLRAAEGSESERARRYREILWFDLIRLQADKEYLRVHLDDLRAALGEGAT
jgi:hypothetical protein